MSASSGEKSKNRILIIVENLPVPPDRRVWQEARALVAAGYTVSIICPSTPKWPARFEVIEGIHIFRHPLPLEANGAVGYILEYSSALFWEALLSIKVKWKIGFDVIQACNPPDTIFLIAIFYKIFFKARFVFDHHDINPELYEAKFARRDFFYRILCWLERMTFRSADVSLATNERFKDIAVRRGGMKPEDVYVVRSIPDLTRFKRLPAKVEVRKERRIVAGYIGIIGAQDGLDILIEAMNIIVNKFGRTDIQCVIVGDGTEFSQIKSLADSANIGDFVTFTGFITGDEMLSTLSAFDIGVIPDPVNPYNDKISMNKVFEYMILGIPSVQFNLSESREMAGDAALTLEECSAVSLAGGIMKLADDDELRGRLAAASREVLTRGVDWDAQVENLLAAYMKILGPDPVRSSR